MSEKGFEPKIVGFLCRWCSSTPELTWPGPVASNTHLTSYPSE